MPEYTTLAKALQSSLMLSRLRLPEPTVFNGDPLLYTEWKAAFVTLIDNKARTPQDKFYFLKKYVGKEVGKAIQGYFLSHIKTSYHAAWKTLEERYENPFILQKAFRERLASWPTVGPRDAEGLWDFSDFLKGCQKAMAYISSLQVLNDCMENQRLMQKLPNWASTRRNQQVTNQLQATAMYPDFDTFVNFVVGETWVACNPVSSLSALTEKPAHDPKHKQASVMATNTDASSNCKDLQNKSNTEKETSKKCLFCESDNNYLPKCSSFTKRSLDEHRKFIRDQRRCYGCLSVGHDSHDCKQKHTCQTCKSKHPTFLHDENFRMKRDNDTESQENTNATPKASATATTLNKSSKDDSTTSTILPVWVSTKHNPEQEKLVYALLDTQSNTTFVDKATCEALNAQAQPIRLKITTMTQRNQALHVRRSLVCGSEGMHQMSPSTYPLHIQGKPFH